MAPTSELPAKRPFRFKLPLQIFAGVCLGFCLLLVVRHLVFSAKIKEKLSQIRAANEPVTLQELNSYYAEVPDEKNAGKIYAQAFESMQRSGSYNGLEGTADLPDRIPSPEVPPEIENAVTNNQTALAELRKAADLSDCRYPIDYTPGWNALLPQLNAIRACGNLERYNGVVKMHTGDVDGAIQSVTLISKYAASLNSEPDLISVLTQEGLDLRAYDLARWIINHRQLSSEQLTALQKVFNQTGPTNWIDRAVIGERCSTVAVFDYPAADLMNVISPTGSGPFDVPAIRLVRLAGQSKKDEIIYLERLEEIRQAARLPFPERLKRAVALDSEIRHQSSLHLLFVTGSILPPMLKIINRDAQHTARMRLIQTALAIEQFRLKHGELPKQLQDLKPDYLKDIPLDPFDEKELRYSKTADGYLLYSVGPNQVDDGGYLALPLISKEAAPAGDLSLPIHR